MNYLCIASPGSGGKTTSACVTLAHFLAEEIKRRPDTRPSVLVLSPNDYHCRVVTKKLEQYAEFLGFVRGDEERGSYTLDAVLVSALPQVWDRQYKFVLADDVPQAVIDALLQNRASFKAASVIHTLDTKRHSNVAA